MHMSTNNKALLERANAAIAKGDSEGFLSHCTDDVAWVFVGGRTVTGKEEVRRYILATYLETPTFVVDQLIAEGDFVTAIGDIGITDGAGRSTRSDRAAEPGGRGAARGSPQARSGSCPRWCRWCAGEMRAQDVAVGGREGEVALADRRCEA